ncbi:kinase-like domain-containing protein [Trichoderma barbatum]
MQGDLRPLITSLEKRIQDWMWEATLISRLLQGISPSKITNVGQFIKQWLKEHKEIRVTALLPQLLQSILSSAEIKTGRNFRLEEKAQHSKQPNKQISKAPETRSSSGRKGVKAYVVKAVDTPLDENALTQASGKMPEVRLVINSPYIRSEDLETLKENSVDFTVKSYLRFNTHMEPFGFWCDIIYDPAGNNCHLYNRSELSIYLISSGESPIMQEINCGGQEPICSGAWRIAIKSEETKAFLYPIFDILVRDKSFTISADNDNKVATVLGTNLFPRDLRGIQYTATSFRTTRTSILDLVDGETVHIKDLHDDKKTYDLQRVKKIASSSKASVFSCRHSRVADIELVAKVCRFDNKLLTQEQMKREMEILKQLRHPNIVKLKAADPRVFALYLEGLPLSLDKNCELGSSWADAKTILFDISSALTYLSKLKIIHYDVKPSNIAFSRERGAILFDFDLADYLKPKYSSPGGTFGFLPPEAIEPGNTRGFPGDVWALGVTILSIVKMEDSINFWDPMANMNDLHQPESYTYKRVVERLRSVALQRSLLNPEDKIQALVYKMLEPKSEARVTAAVIHGKDDRKPQGGRSAKKRRHS